VAKRLLASYVQTQGDAIMSRCGLEAAQSPVGRHRPMIGCSKALRPMSNLG
jgi:hypothetical protein